MLPDEDHVHRRAVLRQRQMERLVVPVLLVREHRLAEMADRFPGLQHVAVDLHDVFKHLAPKALVEIFSGSIAAERLCDVRSDEAEI